MGVGGGKGSQEKTTTRTHVGKGSHFWVNTVNNLENQPS
jgi:hypothetical protein